MSEVTLSLTKEEIQFLINVVGNLPTQSNAWPLLQKIVKQVQEAEPQE